MILTTNYKITSNIDTQNRKSPA